MPNNSKNWIKARGFKMNCEICKISLKISKKRFCSDYCRAKFYQRKGRISFVNEIIKSNQLNSLRLTVKTLVDDGWFVYLRRNEN